MADRRIDGTKYVHKEEYIATLSACTWLFFMYVFLPSTFGRAASFVSLPAYLGQPWP